MSAAANLPDDAVRAQLQKILASRTFAHSDRLRRFLHYSVEQTIARRPENLREYVIGLEVFDRGHDYNPANDPIVRVEARRLRTKLNDYYEAEGKHDPVIIDVPKGSYIPSFQPRQRAGGQPPGRRAQQAILLGAMLAGAAALLGALWWIAQPKVETTKLTLSRLTSDSGLTTDAAISPNGALIAYASDRGGKGDLDIWVQQVAGGNPIQLTREPADDQAPAFSPDSSTIAFRSERAPAGVYAVPALGGAAKLIARDGQDPRYSPDGKWIAYWIGSRGGEFLPPAGKIYIMRTGGGPSEQICEGFSSAAFPVWSPDANRLLFEGTRDPATSEHRNFDWWIVSLRDRTVSRTGDIQILGRHHLVLPPRRRGVAWSSNKLIFAATSGDSTSLWELQLRGKTPSRLTLGSSLETDPSIASNGTIAFSSLSETIDIWSLRMNTNRGEMASFSERVTEAAARSIFPSVSRDGGKAAYLSNKGRGNDLWFQDLRTGQELALGHRNARYPRINRAGTMVAFLEGGTLFVIPSAGGEAKSICQDCGRPWDWSPDDTRILYVERGSPSAVGELAVSSGSKRVLLRNDQHDLANAQFSPDGGWIGFHAIGGPTKRQIFISRYPPAGDWIGVTDGTGLDRNCVWSRDGGILYYLSERDGFRCIWAQRLEATTKKPMGAPFAAAHFHSARRSLLALGDVGAIGLSVAPEKLIFSLGEVTGNVWIASAEPKP
jgi:Tol biopolymer transport system component